LPTGTLLFGGVAPDGSLARELYFLDGGAQLLSVAPEGRAGASCAANNVALSCSGGLGALHPDAGFSSLTWLAATNSWAEVRTSGYQLNSGAALSSVPVPGGILFAGLLFNCDSDCDGPGAYRWNGQVLRRVPDAKGFGLLSPAGIASTPAGPEWLGFTDFTRPVHFRWTPTGAAELGQLPAAVNLSRGLAGFGLDSTRGLYVYGGGVDSTATGYQPVSSTFVGDAGAQLAAGPALPAAGPVVAVDRPDLGGLVFYGGNLAARFEGAQWVAAPGPAQARCVAYDALRGELFISDGSLFTSLTAADGGVTRLSGLTCPLGFDPGRGRVSSFSQSLITEVDLRGARPRLALSLDARAAAPGDGGVQRVSFELLAGGEGTQAGQRVSGARARVAGGPSPSNTASAAAPGPLAFSVTAVADDGGFRANGQLSLQVEPVGTNGVGEASVVVSGRAITWLKR
jgi:hypothetical protein